MRRPASAQTAPVGLASIDNGGVRLVGAQHRAVLDVLSVAVEADMRAALARIELTHRPAVESAKPDQPAAGASSSPTGQPATPSDRKQRRAEKRRARGRGRETPPDGLHQASYLDRGSDDPLVARPDDSPTPSDGPDDVAHGERAL